MNKPWLSEPNERKWVDKVTGLTCLIQRADLGHLCGYVRIPCRSTLYRKVNSGENINVHGGVTFKGEMRRKAGGRRRGRWVGFDCAHCYDLAPMIVDLAPSFASHGIYRDFTFVTREVEGLARQVR